MSAPRQEQTILTPSQVGQYIKGFMDRDRVLSGLLVRGELSNYKMYPSGHHYFTLKDGEGALRCVMFRGDAASLRFHPQNGMQVIAAGRVTVFPRDGQYQLYCVRLTPEGAGDLAVAFEQMKARLLQEGLFDRAHKRPLPRIPGRIALVTSPAGAAVRDMLRILGARWPMAQIRILPVRVQGEGAAEEIAAAIRWANLHQAADLIITGRGGGSMEDLWAFNEECVARAVYDSQIPVISAVGHEPDVTIADFTADLRAATPSNAAELAVPTRTRSMPPWRRWGRAWSRRPVSGSCGSASGWSACGRAGSWPIRGAIFRRSACCWTIRAAAWDTACPPAYPASGSALPGWPPHWTPSAP